MAFPKSNFENTLFTPPQEANIRRRFYCKLCGTSFILSSNFHQHIITIHETGKDGTHISIPLEHKLPEITYRCTHCLGSYPNQIATIAHFFLEEHLHPSDTACTPQQKLELKATSNTWMPTNQILIEFVPPFTENQKAILVCLLHCPDCNFVSVDADTIDAHIKQIHNTQSLPYLTFKCKECCQIYQTYGDILAHFFIIDHIDDTFCSPPQVEYLTNLVGSDLS